MNTVDETGWKVGGRLQWLHVAVSAQVSVHAILPGRGYEQSRVLLGAVYDGFLVHDGWAPYYRFRLAFHQSCLNHLLTRCREMARSFLRRRLPCPRRCSICCRPASSCGTVMRKAQSPSTG